VYFLVKFYFGISLVIFFVYWHRVLKKISPLLYYYYVVPCSVNNKKILTFSGILLTVVFFSWTFLSFICSLYYMIITSRIY